MTITRKWTMWILLCSLAIAPTCTFSFQYPHQSSFSQSTRIRSNYQAPPLVSPTRHQRRNRCSLQEQLQPNEEKDSDDSSLLPTDITTTVNSISSTASSKNPASSLIKPTRRHFVAATTALLVPGLVLSSSSFAESGVPPPNVYTGFKPGSKQARKIGGLANRIRGICKIMDELQRDLMEHRWDLIESYPSQLRSYVPIFTTYTDTAFDSDEPSDKGLRVALRYEVGRFFAGLERFRRASSRQALDEAYLAYSDMSLHLDRYLRVGGVYTYYDSTIDNEKYFQGYDNALVIGDPVKDPADVCDLIVLCKGPDKGRTGIVIAIYRDGSKNCVVKLDQIKGMREIRVVPLLWAAKRVGEGKQDQDGVFSIPRKHDPLASAGAAT